MDQQLIGLAYDVTWGWLEASPGKDAPQVLVNLLEQHGLDICFVTPFQPNMAAGGYLAYPVEQQLGGNNRADMIAGEPGSLAVQGKVGDHYEDFHFPVYAFGRSPLDAAMRYNETIAQQIYAVWWDTPRALAQHLYDYGWLIRGSEGHYTVTYSHQDITFSVDDLTAAAAMEMMGLCRCAFATEAFTLLYRFVIGLLREQALSLTWQPIVAAYGVEALKALLDEYELMICHILDAAPELGSFGRYLGYTGADGLSAESLFALPAEQPDKVRVLGNAGVGDYTYLRFDRVLFGQTPIEAAMRARPRIAHDIYLELWGAPQVLATYLFDGGWRVVQVGDQYFVLYTMKDREFSSGELTEEQALDYMGLCPCTFALHAFLGVVEKTLEGGK